MRATPFLSGVPLGTDGASPIGTDDHRVPPEAKVAAARALEADGQNGSRSNAVAVGEEPISVRACALGADLARAARVPFVFVGPAVGGLLRARTSSHIDL
jgi:hypothetical protein